MCEKIARLFRQLTHGVYVIGVAHGEVCNAFTAAWMMRVSFNPLLLALSINSIHPMDYWPAVGSFPSMS